MIKVNEIRIGNILEWNKQQFNVCRIFSQNEGVENENWTKPCSELHPIPLTEELLVKCSLFPKNINFSELTRKVNISFCLSFILHVSKDGVYFGDTKICFLHQLQNLYFALTGEELKINLVV